MTYTSGRFLSHSLHKRFSKFCNFLQKTSNINNKGWTRWEYPRCILSERVDQSHLTTESFKRELVSNASAQLFPDNTLSSFTNFSPEQLNLEGQWEVAVSERSYPSMYQNVTKGKFLYFDKIFSKSSEFFYLEPGVYPSITDIVQAKNTFIQESQNHSENCTTVKVSRRTQKLRFTLQMKDLAFHSLVRI